LAGKIIALLTDFGTKDHFVGAMKGAILTINPEAQIVDITHEIPKFNTWTGGFVLYNAAEFFPRGSIFVAVVDPGVGSGRKIILLRSRNGKFFIAPDNGILTFVCLKMGVEWIRNVRNRKFMLKKISATFHGRDIMAPVAAHLSAGADPEQVGPRVKRITTLKVMEPQREGKTIYGQIWHIDGFGNIITNIHESFGLRRGMRVDVEVPARKIEATFGKTFSDVRPGECVAYFGSSGLLEIAKNMGNLAAELRVKTGQEIIIRW